MSGKTHWENVYREKSAQEVSWYQATPTRSLELIAETGIAREAPVIDVGGGASTLVDGLLHEGYSDISVLDIASSALQVAQQRLGESAASVRWLEADITGFQPPRRYALWHDRAVFHFLTEAEDRSRYVAALKQGLMPDGHLLIAAFAIGGPTRCSGLDTVQYDAEKLSAELGENFHLEGTCSEEHLTPAGKQQAFNYFHYRYRP